ncbi:hypothetical protein IKW73_02270 [Candidatus Saccharibacteria bacterium]|nr:hypothetical protein [Candidatus Saccharibacteria bacterium]
MKIAILGAGAFGTALGGILAEKGHDIDYYDSSRTGDTLRETVADADMIVLAVPSKAAPYVLPNVPHEIPLIVATKGILSDKTFEDFPDFMILSGPGFADDIKAQKKTILTATDQRVIDLFTTDYLTFDYTDDEKGVLMCGALKNIYALYCGLLGLEAGTPEHTKFLHETAKEMAEVLEANGAKAATIDCVCGKGDLKLTCNYPSRNYEFGQILRKNPKAVPEKTVEGLSALSKVKNGAIIVPETATKLKDLIDRSKEWV